MTISGVARRASAPRSHRNDDQVCETVVYITKPTPSFRRRSEGRERRNPDYKLARSAATIVNC